MTGPALFIWLAYAALTVLFGGFRGFTAHLLYPRGVFSAIAMPSLFLVAAAVAACYATVTVTAACCVAFAASHLVTGGLLDRARRRELERESAARALAGDVESGG